MYKYIKFYKQSDLYFKMLQDKQSKFLTCPQKAIGLFAATFGFQQVIQEKGVPIEVAACKAARFGGEAVGPGEACALHPSWGIGFGAGVDIEGKAY